MELRENPYLDRGKYFYRDLNQISHGPFKTYGAALRALLYEIDRRSKWVVLKNLWQELWT